MAVQFMKLFGESFGRAKIAFVLGALTIVGAWAFQYIGGYQPCELCYAQRAPYYIGLPMLAVLLNSWKLLPVLPRALATLAVAGIFVWSTYLGGYHAGVEWGFWPGPTACTGTGAGISFSDLNAINDTRVVPCDVVQWRFLGLSFAGYNTLISLSIVVLLAWSVLGQFKASK